MNRFTSIIKYPAFLLPAFAMGISLASADDRKNDAPCDQERASVNAEQDHDRHMAEKASLASARASSSDKAKAAADADKAKAHADMAKAKANSDKAKVKADAAIAEAEADAEKAKVKADAAIADAEADAEKAKVKADAAMAEAKTDAKKAKVKGDAAMAEAKAEADKAEVDADAAETEIRNQNYISNQSANDYFSTDVIGKEITNTRNNKVVGEVDEILINQHGQISAVIISTGGIMGLGEKKVAIAWDQIEHTVDGDETKLTIDLSKDSLGDAPAFSRNKSEK